jgi:thiamine pyrophosphate-dependent acetolactate synthase large subunit-like protein
LDEERRNRGTRGEAGLDRRQAMRLLLEDRGELLLVTGLGATSWDAAACGDDPRNFTLWGAMGGAATVGLGIALARPERPVLVVTGDGEMLMGLSCLATIAVARPRNLAIAVFDNGRYGETGMQASHTQEKVSLAAVARACGIERVFDIADEAALSDFARLLARREGTLFARVKILAEELPRVLPPRDGAYLRTRFRRALGLESG